MVTRKPTLTVAQALKVIRLEIETLTTLRQNLSVHILDIEAEVAKQQNRETLFEAIDATIHELEVLRGQVLLQDPKTVETMIQEGRIDADTEIPEVDLSAGQFTHRVTIVMPNKHKFNRGLQVVAQNHELPQKYWDVQKRHLPLFNKLTDPTATQLEIDAALEQHTMKELNRTEPKR